MPCLLLKNQRLVKTVKFKNPQYIGDPVNAIKIYNEKEVDELIILDISASVNQQPPDYEIIENISNECFMPVTYGGGITNTTQMQKIFNLGIEKIAINHKGLQNISFFTEASKEFGCQSVVASIDVKKTLLGRYLVTSLSGNYSSSYTPGEYAKQVESAGAGEILLYSIERDGTWSGFDYNLIQAVSGSISIPLIACGGAGKITDFAEAVKHGASAVAIGSMAVYQGKDKGVLIKFPSKDEINSVLLS
ncbi:AglZ/HisF2 family acetamidino modification protein [Methanospirillum stamsii]|nr:AglZ/HisF2 family acetamidino modification protein [Methanospirillum stamsii]